MQKSGYGGRMRLQLATAKVLRVMLEDPERPRYGLELVQETGSHSGTVFPLLFRLKDAGLVTSKREQVDPRAEGRPARVYYRLTPAGTEYARRELTRLADWLRPPAEQEGR